MIDVLVELTAFREFPLNGLSRLAEGGRNRRFAAGRQLMRQGEIGDTMFVILRGRVRVERSDPSLAAPLLLAELGEGEVVGEMGILNAEPRSATVTAIEDTEAMELSAGTLFSTVEDEPEVAGALLRLLSRRLRRTDELMEDALARLNHQNELILSSVDEGICRLGVDGRVSFVNPAAAHMLGYAPEDLLGQDLHALVHHSKPDGSLYPKEECPVYAALRDGVPRRGANEVYWRKDGSSFPVEYVSAPLWEEGRTIGAVIGFRDITERREVEQMKDEFISIVSHELRTPLTSIRGSLGLLASGQLGDLPERAQRMADIAVNNTDRLVRLINDLLDIERMESGKATMEKADCNAAELMERAAEVMGPMAEKAGVTLSVAPLDARLFADPDRLIQTLTNLLSNAIKFSPEGGTVWLAAERQGEQVLFQVKDQGRGIPPEKIDTVFERFQQVDASDAREKGGTGLGLPICRSIVYQHGGQIWVESAPGQGTTFFFTLPAVSEVEVEASALELAGPPVLVCADDPVAMDFVHTALAQQGYQAIAVASAQEAVERSAGEPPAALLIDLMAQGVDGWDIMAALKEQSSVKDTPVIFFTVLTPEEALPAEAEQTDAVGQIPHGTRFDVVGRLLRERKWGGRILIVEDDEDLARVLAASFERHGIQTFHARTGQEAILLTQRVVPNLLILDLILPNGDGYTVVDWLRRHDRLRSLPLVVYSAKDLDTTDRERLKLGQTLFFTKGRVSPQEFEQRIVGLLDRITLRTAEGESDASQAHPGD